MATGAGKRYVSESGAEVIVTRGGASGLSDGETPLLLKEDATATADPSGRSEPLIQLGKRFRSADGEVELLVLKAGVCDLRYDGAPMEIMQPKILPSAD